MTPKASTLAEGGDPSFTWKTSGLASATTTRLQEKTPGASTWKTVKVVSTARSGSGTVKLGAANTPGSYSFRLVASYTSGGKTEALSATKTVTVKKPSVALTAVHSTINAGSAPSFTYTLSYLPSGTTAYLQRQEGTAKTWTNLVKLTKSSGTVTPAKLSSLGAYAYRILATKKSGTKTVTVASTVSRTIRAYGAVPLATLWYETNGYSTTPGTVQVGSNLFNYQVVDNFVYGEWPNTSIEVKYTSTTCKSLSVQWAQPKGDPYAQVIQASSDEQDAQAALNAVGSHTFSLDGGAFQFSVAKGTSDYSDTVYLAGSAQCYSTTGR